MEKHASDIARVMDDLQLGRAALAGVSIGGIPFSNSGVVFAGALQHWYSWTPRRCGYPRARNTRLQTAADVWNVARNLHYGKC